MVERKPMARDEAYGGAAQPMDMTVEAELISAPAAAAGFTSANISRIRVQDIKAFSDQWLREHRSVVDSMPDGTVLAVDMSSGDFVKASTGLAAMDTFEETFGPKAVAWVFEVGVPITLGCGLWQLK